MWCEKNLFDLWKWGLQKLIAFNYCQKGKILFIQGLFFQSLRNRFNSDSFLIKMRLINKAVNLINTWMMGPILSPFLSDKLKILPQNFVTRVFLSFSCTVLLIPVKKDAASKHFGSQQCSWATLDCIDTTWCL